MVSLKTFPGTVSFPPLVGVLQAIIISCFILCTPHVGATSVSAISASSHHSASKYMVANNGLEASSVENQGIHGEHVLPTANKDVSMDTTNPDYVSPQELNSFELGVVGDSDSESNNGRLKRSLEEEKAYYDALENSQSKTEELPEAPSSDDVSQSPQDNTEAPNRPEPEEMTTEANKEDSPAAIEPSNTDESPPGDPAPDLSESQNSDTNREDSGQVNEISTASQSTTEPTTELSTESTSTTEPEQKDSVPENGKPFIWDGGSTSVLPVDTTPTETPSSSVPSVEEDGKDEEVKVVVQSFNNRTKGVIVESQKRNSSGSGKVNGEVILDGNGLSISSSLSLGKEGFNQLNNINYSHQTVINNYYTLESGQNNSENGEKGAADRPGMESSSGQDSITVKQPSEVDDDGDVMSGRNPMKKNGTQSGRASNGKPVTGSEPCTTGFEAECSVSFWEGGKDDDDDEDRTTVKPGPPLPTPRGVPETCVTGFEADCKVKFWEDNDDDDDDDDKNATQSQESSTTVEELVHELTMFADTSNANLSTYAVESVATILQEEYADTMNKTGTFNNGDSDDTNDEGVKTYSYTGDDDSSLVVLGSKAQSGRSWFRNMPKSNKTLTKTNNNVAKPDPTVGGGGSGAGVINQQLQNMTLEIEELNIKLLEKDLQLQEKDLQLQEKDKLLQQKDLQLQQKDLQLQEKDLQLKERKLRQRQRKLLKRQKKLRPRQDKKS